MFRAHVLIIRRSKLYFAASGIITPIGYRPVHGMATYRVMHGQQNIKKFSTLLYDIKVLCLTVYFLCISVTVNITE